MAEVLAINDDDNIGIQDFINYVPYSVVGENLKDIPIDFSACGIYSVDEKACKKVNLGLVTISSNNIIIDGGDFSTNLDECIKVIGKKIKVGDKYDLKESYYPSGTKIFNVPGHRLKIGDDVCIIYKTNNAWVQKLNMKKYWPSGFTFEWFAKVSDINGTNIKLDSPITYALNKAYGTASICKYTNNRIKNIIIRNITIRTSSNTSQNIGIYLENCENVLIENVKVYGFDRGIKISDGSNHITVRNCNVYESNASAVGGNRYAYEIDAGTNCLVENCSAFKSRHPYAGGGKCCGPHVFYNCQAIDNVAGATSQPHRLWGNGFLYDNISESNGISFENREDSGSGHGWAAANCIAWNCKAKIICENPPTARNFAIGCIGGRNKFFKGDPNRPMHTIISEGVSVAPQSLFIYQCDLKSK